MNSTVSVDLTVEQSQLARLALGIAIRDARLSLAKSKSISDRYATEQLIAQYKAVERTLYEAQKEMLREKGVNI